MKKRNRQLKKKLSRGLRLARQRWVRFQGRHDPHDNLTMDECVLCDGEGCKTCNYAGLTLGEWADIDDHPMRGMHQHSKVVQDTNGGTAGGRFKGWDGKRKNIPPSCETP